MLSRFIPDVMQRQRETLPIAIAQLETLRIARDLTRSSVLRITDMVAHDLRNNLMVVTMVMDLPESLKSDDISLPRAQGDTFNHWDGSVYPKP